MARGSVDFLVSSRWLSRNFRCAGRLVPTKVARLRGLLNWPEFLMKTQKTSTRITRKAAKTADLPSERKPKLKATAKPNTQSSSSAKAAAKSTTKKRTLKI